MSVHIPIAWVKERQWLPTVCARHGQPPTRQMWIDIYEALPLWIHALLWTPIGTIALALYRGVSSTSVFAPWPFCDHCARRRLSIIALSISAAALGVLMFVAGEVWLSWTSAVLVAFRATGLVLLAAAITFWFRANWGTISGARLGDHSAFVEVVNAHDAFAAQVVTAKHQAARQAVWSGQSPSETQPPQRLLGKLSTLWYLALVAGIMLLFLGVFALAGPQCGARSMQPGDLCETTEDGRTTVSTYEEEQAWVRRKMFGGAMGVVLIVVSGVRIRLWNKALRRAYAAASGNAVT